MNASPVEGENPAAISQLLTHPLVNSAFIPSSEGAIAENSQNPHAANHTTNWGLRADYVLPSNYGFAIKGGGVFWPRFGQFGANWLASRELSSDHRLVWLDLAVTEK